MIQYDLVPHLYDLFWRSKGSVLGISIRDSCVEEVFTDADKWKYVEYLQKEKRVGDVVHDPSVGFGFEKAMFQRLPGKNLDGCVKFGVQLPRIERGKSGHQTFAHLSPTMIVHVLDMLLSRLSIVDDVPETGRHQLATYEVAVADRPMHGYPLCGAFNHKILTWLAEPENSELVHTRQAMEQVFRRMYIRKQSSFRSVAMPDGRFSLRVPGDCACLGPDGSDSRCLKDGEGYDFGSHNVDTPVQQLALLAGVVTIVNEAQAAINKKT